MSDLPRYDLAGALSLLTNAPRPLVPFPSLLRDAQKENPSINYGGITVLEDDDVRSTSYIGTPIFYPIVLRGGTYNRHDREGKVEQVTVGDFRLPLTCVVEMSRQKTITTTPLVAARASVKEIYAHEDWQLRISGLLHDEPRHPQGAQRFEDMTERLLQFESLADSIEIDGELFHQRGIYRIVIESISFNQMPGKPRMHGFQMQCTSDEALELIIA